MRVVWLSGILAFLADQLSKYAVVHSLGLIDDLDGRIKVLSPFLEFRMAWNRGVNFGLLSNYDPKWFLIVVSLVICVGILWWAYKASLTLIGKISAGLLIGGAMGNVVDRLIYGAVADFLNMSCCGLNNPFAFNVADVAIFAGAFGVAFFSEVKVQS